MTSELKPGDRVRVKGERSEGRILDKVVVDFGGGCWQSFDRRGLEPIDPAPAQPEATGEARLLRELETWVRRYFGEKNGQGPVFATEIRDVLRELNETRRAAPPTPGTVRVEPGEVIVRLTREAAEAYMWGALDDIRGQVRAALSTAEAKTLEPLLGLLTVRVPPAIAEAFVEGFHPATGTAAEYIHQHVRAALADAKGGTVKCERAGCKVTASGYDLFDYCAVCSRNLCDAHMAAGCCGNVPAKSGMELDAGDVEPAANGEGGA